MKVIGNPLVTGVELFLLYLLAHAFFGSQLLAGLTVLILVAGSAAYFLINDWLGEEFEDDV